jgi:hypothetical protein
VRGRWLALGLAAILVLAIGVAIGRRTTGPAAPGTRAVVTVTGPSPDADSSPSETETPSGMEPTGYARTPEGAVAAATAYVAALGGPAILDPAAVRTTLTAIASSESREGLIRAYELAAAQARKRLGAGTASDPTVVFRTAPVGYRVDGFQRRGATVSVWRVGIVGSGATVQPRQSWRTETLSLVWEDGSWKVDAVRSAPGPTPPLAGPAPTPPAELSAAIPRFEEFTNELP